MKRIILYTIFFTALFSVVYFGLRYSQKRQIKAEICRFLPISPQQLTFVKFYDIMGGVHGEGYTFGIIQSSNSLDIGNIKALHISEGVDNIS